MTTPIRPPGAQPVEGTAAAGAHPPVAAPAAAIRRPVRVDAMRVSATNAAEVADWCGGSVLGNAVRVPFSRGADRWELLAKPGYWVVMESEGACMVDVLTDVEFAHSMKQVNA